MRRSVLFSVLAISLATSSFVSIDTVFAGSHTTAQAVTSGKGDRSRLKSKLSVDLGTSFVKPKSEVNESSGGTTIANVSGSSSKNITSIGIDYRVPLFLVLANLGNVANVDLSCPDCRADVANLGFRPQGPVVGLWGRAFFGGNDRNEVGFNLHPTPGTDTVSAYSKSLFILPYVGYQFALMAANNPIDLTLFAGPRFERRKLKFTTNEGTGVEEFSNSETDVGLTIGFDVDMPVPGLFNVSNVQSSRTPFLRFGMAYDWSPAIKVAGRSASGIDYTDKIKSGGALRIFFGAGVMW